VTFTTFFTAFEQNEIRQHTDAHDAPTTSLNIRPCHAGFVFSRRLCCWVPCRQRFDVLQELREAHVVMVPPKRITRSRRMADHEPVRSRLSTVRGWLSDDHRFLAAVDGIVAARVKHRPRAALPRPRVNPQGLT
jgi:hypothetical protein